MKKGLFLLFLAVPCFGEGPRYRHLDPTLNKEVVNIYQDFRDLGGKFVQNSSTSSVFQTFYVTSGTITNQLGIGTQGITGKPDGSLTIVNLGRSTDPSRQGISIDATNNSVSELPFIVFTNRSTPALSIGGAIAYLQQMPDGTDIQQGILAFSQQSTTSTAKFQLYLRAGNGSSPASDSLPVMRILGQATTGYSQTLFGPPYMTPGSTLHVESDSSDVDSGIRIERGNIKTNASRYNLFIDSSGNLVIKDVDQGASLYGLKISTSGEVIIKGTKSNLTTNTGDYGEMLTSATVVTSTFGTTGTFKDLVGVALTKGNWFVQGCVEAGLNGATFSDWTVSISSVPGNSNSTLVLGDNRFSGLPPTSNSNSSACVPLQAVSVNVDTTYFLKPNASYSVAIPKASGKISAVRRN